MSGSREEERRKLADIINHWNANRLDLFEISQPTEGSPVSVPGLGLSAFINLLGGTDGQSACGPHRAPTTPPALLSAQVPGDLTGSGGFQSC
ncbi:hypothetical protein SRHO_G00065370 [Serrasalmus rhombeus]